MVRRQISDDMVALWHGYVYCFPFRLVLSTRVCKSQQELYYCVLLVRMYIVMERIALGLYYASQLGKVDSDSPMMWVM